MLGIARYFRIEQVTSSMETNFCRNVESVGDILAYTSSTVSYHTLQKINGTFTGIYNDCITGVTFAPMVSLAILERDDHAWNVHVVGTSIQIVSEIVTH